MLVCFFVFAREAAGAAKRPAFPAPSAFRGPRCRKARAKRAAGLRSRVQVFDNCIGKNPASSPGLNGPPSIPQAAALNRDVGGILDASLSRGMTAECIAIAPA